VLAGHANVRGVEGQVNAAVEAPLMRIGTEDPEPVSVAVPVMPQLPVGVGEKVPDPIVTVSVDAVAVKG
jgi:hypothetical protein